MKSMTVQDDPKLLDDDGKIPESQERGWRFNTRLWNLPSKWQKKLVRLSTASSALPLTYGPSVSKKIKKIKKLSMTFFQNLWQVAEAMGVSLQLMEARRRDQKKRIHRHMYTGLHEPPLYRGLSPQAPRKFENRIPIRSVSTQFQLCWNITYCWNSDSMISRSFSFWIWKDWPVVWKYSPLLLLGYRSLNLAKFGCASKFAQLFTELSWT